MTPKILIIEDNEQNLDLPTFLLKRHGLEIIPSGSGTLGVELAKDRRPDLILLDIQLPGMDGYEVARQVNQLPSPSGVPIVAVTSYAMERDRDQGFAAGFVGYIAKPINSKTFLSEIRPFLSAEWEPRTT